MLRSPITTLLLAVALSACGPTTPATPRCQASNCAGCCASSTECLTGTRETSAACGTGVAGAACRACPSGQSCSAAANKCVATVVDSGTPEPDAGACGFKGLPCCEGVTCDTGLSCARGYCSLPKSDAGCGALDQACCAGSCYLPNSCQGGVCAAGSADSGVTDGGIRLKTTGQACGQGVECFDGTCLTAGFPGGVCTRACTTSADCLAGSQCGTNPTGTGPAKICLAQCTTPGTSPDTCRIGYGCERNAATSGVPVCYPPCSGFTCAAGSCDPASHLCCGANSQACCGGSTCLTGNCTDKYCSASSCGGVGQDCCAGSACNGQAVCSGTTCVACGVASQPCCANSVCSDTSTCVGGTCARCGQTDQLCCGGNLCSTGNTCLGNKCSLCGGVGQPCCDGSTCGSGAACANGTCTVIGTACLTGGTQCVGKLCLSDPAQLSYPGGYCTVNCALGNNLCPLGSACSPYVDTAGTFCFADCVWDGGAGGCRDGYVCDNVLGTVVCVNACKVSGECASKYCQSGFCCGQKDYKCCDENTCPVSGTCNPLSGYCN